MAAQDEADNPDTRTSIAEGEMYQKWSPKTV
jgi:hypothetical protein